LRATVEPSDRIANGLGASRPAGTTLFVLFIPSVDRDGAAIDHDHWVDQALSTLARLFRGATAYPRGVGMWRDDDRGGVLVTDEPTIVTCYADPTDVTSAALAELRAFLHRLGRDAHQGEVGIVVDGSYYPITHYDDA
jgi:hypothetical protein